jgi:polyisoprenoid-binding protein YceI
MKPFIAIIALANFAAAAYAAPITYNLDPNHTHPGFEVDHLGGLSVWRGNFKKCSGKVTLDAAAQTGTVEVIIDTTSIDIPNDKLVEHVSSPEMLDVAKFPTATYKGTLGDFRDGAPTTAAGNLTLHGVTKPVALKINSFKCIQHPMLKKQVCGADATGTFNRSDFGVNYGDKIGFKQDVVLHIQVEGIKAE